MNSFKFIHAADVHLDSPLQGLSRYDGVPVRQVRSATREALQNLVEAALREQVAFVVIAGDLYDGDWGDFSTGLYFCAAMGRLERAGIRVVLLFGNHDAESVITRKLPLPANVSVFDARKSHTILVEDVQTALHGRSFKDRQTTENLAVTYPLPKANWFNIGVLHTALAGEDGHETYAPCSLDELTAKNYDYWALGHVHTHKILARDPFIVFSGNLQGRNIRETGPKGAVLVTVRNGSVIAAEHLALDVVRWCLLEISAADLNSVDDLHRCAREEFIRALQNEADGRPILVRILVRGATSLHAQLLHHEPALRAEMLGIAAALSNEIWIEKISVLTQAVSAASTAKDAVLAADLQQLLLAGMQDGGIAAEVKTHLDEFIHKLPPGLGEAGSSLDQIRRGNMNEFLQSSMAALLARLADEAA